MAEKRGQAKNLHSKAGKAKHTYPDTSKTHAAAHTAKHAPARKGRMEGETYAPSPAHTGRYRIPLGIRFLIGYLIFISFLYVLSFISSITFPTTVLFGQLVTGPRAIVVNAFLLALIAAVIYGLWSRRAYAFDLSIGLFMFNTLNSFLSITLFEWTEHPFKKFMLLSFASLVLVNIVVIWYIMHERKYFYAKVFREGPVHHIDKVFLYTVVTFWVVAALIGVTMGVQYYQETTAKIDNVIGEMKGDYLGRGDYTCYVKTGEDKDICLLVLATAKQRVNVPTAALAEDCRMMESDFYRFACMRMIS